MTPTCPICYVPMMTFVDYLDGHTLCESDETCPHGCYSHQYAYGNTQVTIKIRGQNIIFFHNYMESLIDSQATHEAIQELFEPARAALIEDLRANLL